MRSNKARSAAVSGLPPPSLTNLQSIFSSLAFICNVGTHQTPLSPDSNPQPETEPTPAPASPPSAIPCPLHPTRPHTTGPPLAPPPLPEGAYESGASPQERPRGRLRTNRSLAVSLIARFHLGVVHLQAIGQGGARSARAPPTRIGYRIHCRRAFD